MLKLIIKRKSLKGKYVMKLKLSLPSWLNFWG